MNDRGCLPVFQRVSIPGLDRRSRRVINGARALRLLRVGCRCDKLGAMRMALQLSTAKLGLITLVAATLGGCSLSTTPTATPVTPTPQPTTAAPPRRAPTPTPTTTARPSASNTPTQVARSNATRVPIARATPKPDAPAAVTPKVRLRRSTSGPTAVGSWYTQLQAKYHAPGAPVRPSLGWRFPAGGAVSAAPAVVDGTVYFGTTNGAFYAVDALTGLERWRFDAGGWVQGSPAIEGDLVYFGSDDRTVYALDRRSGRLIWRVKLDAEIRTALTATPAAVYVGTRAGTVYALNPRTSRTLWRHSGQAPVTARPVPSNGRVIYGDLDGRLTALNAATGAIVWQKNETASRVRGSPAVSGDTIYIGSSRGLLTALRLRDGNIRWQARIGRGAITAPAVSGGTVYVVAAQAKLGRVVAVRARDGKRIWTVRLPAQSVSSPAVVGGVVYLGARDGTLRAVGARAGKQRWVFRTTRDIDASPVIANGRAYVGSWDGYFYAIGGPRASTRFSRVPTRSLRRDPRADTTGGKAFADIRLAGAAYASYGASRGKGGVPGIAFVAQLSAAPPATSRVQSAYVWAIDNTLDSNIDYYVFVDLAANARKYRATLERNTPEGLVTVNDRLPFEINGRMVRVFLPTSPHLATEDSKPALQWYAYSYIQKLPAQDEISDRGRYFILNPER